MRKTVLMALLVLTSSCGEPRAETVVTDGDTFSMDGVTYRIEGIDAPEKGQMCGSSNGRWPCGESATKALEQLVERAGVQCIGIEEDGFGRTIATCYADGADIGATMVREGHAWAFRKYSVSYVAEENLARTARAGIWQGEAQPAWEYRADRWAVAEQEAPNGCAIKGNINRDGERIYHAPWSRWYARTKISLSDGERWFCNEAEAIAAGWREAR